MSIESIVTCRDDLTLSLHAEGALTGEEAWRIKSHVQHCGRCTRRLAELAAEDAVLAEALAGTVRRVSFLQRFGPWAAALGVLLAGRLGLQLLDDTWDEALGALNLQWFDPRGSQMAGNALYSALFFVTREAMDWLSSYLLPVASVLAGASIVGLLLWSLRRTRLPRVAAAFAFSLACLLVTAAPAAAMTVRKGEDVTVPAGETLHDSLIAAGEVVRIDGIVEGDVVVFAGRVVVKGTITGNLVAWTQRLQLDGTVSGTVFAGAQQVALAGGVGRNAFTFAQTATLPPGGRVDGDLISWVQDLAVDGRVGRDLWAMSETPTVSGEVGRNVRAKTRRLHLLGTAKVAGDVSAIVPATDRVVVDQGASIGGKVSAELPEPKSRKKVWLWRLVGLGAALFTGLFLAWLAPATTTGPVDTLRVLGQAWGRGAIVLFVLIAATIVLCVTLVGLPLGLASLAVFVFALYTGPIVLAGAIGRKLLGAPAGLNARYALGLVAGLVLLTIALQMPFVGVLTRLIATPLGVGMAYTALRARWATATTAERA